MNGVEDVKRSKFYTELNALLRAELPKVKEDISPSFKKILKEKKFQHPLPIVHQFEYAAWGRNSQWRLELDFDDYQWSYKTVKPHFLTALMSMDIGDDVISFKHQLCSSFNDELQPQQVEKIELSRLNDIEFVALKMKAIKQFLNLLPERFLAEVEDIDFNDLEYTMHPKIQEKWQQGYLPGYDCIIMGEGEIIMGNTYSVYDSKTKKTKQYWSPLCDTTIESLEKYDDDIWTEVDIVIGAFIHKNQKFVFGSGAMGNEGFIASISPDNILDWAIFFTFSNPIYKAEVKSEHLICYGDTGISIDIDLKKISKIQII
ncbi:hypothetical protein [Flexithrix dorotheae]|uniref:hypothetical protein n=1 Tax=Flexithrix dorotheae TaxID=70993 RepID=UPI0012FB79EB|nr:hypothetical protein [Flexithrix dorotheae]